MATAEATELGRAVDEVESLVERVKQARTDIFERQMFLDTFGDALDAARVRIAAGKTTVEDDEVLEEDEKPLLIAVVLADYRGTLEDELHALTWLADRWEKRTTGQLEADAARHEAADYDRLCDEARALGITVSLDDTRSPKTVQGLRDAIDGRRP